jgi:DNA-binding NarL/FixJ family response regulator
VKASLDAGADQHLSKPIRADALIEAILHAMAGGGTRGEEEAA